MYKLWESRHADLLLPVAEHGDKKRQIMALRDAKVRLVHRRALFRYLRANEVRGDRRRQLRRHIESEPPDSGCTSFDRQEVLARSGRYSVLNYMVG